MADEETKRRRRAELERGGRPEPTWAEKAKAEEVARLRRLKLEIDLAAFVDFRNPKFDPAMLGDLDRTIEWCPMLGIEKRYTWAALRTAQDDKKLLLARMKSWPRFRAKLEKQLAALDATIAYYEKFVGTGDSPGKAWHHAARLIWKRVCKVLQSAHDAAGRKKRVRLADPILDFICEKLAPVCDQAGEKRSTATALRKVLGERP
jgi:hypothetical protein